MSNLKSHSSANDESVQVAEMKEAETPHHVIELSVVDHNVCLTLMCHFVRFYIEVEAKDLRDDTTRSGNTDYENFINLCEDFEDQQEDLEDWIIRPCLPLLGKLAPIPCKSTTYTLEDYYNPPTYCYRLRSRAGSLVAVQIDSQLADLPQYLDQVSLEKNMSDLQQFTHFSAAELEIVRSFEPDGAEFCPIPKEVLMKGTNQHLAFKAVYDSESLSNELQVYLALQLAPQSKERDNCLVPKLCGLVLSRGKLLGLLLQYIDHDGTLTIRSATASKEEKAKWLEQIKCTVDSLHQQGLIWGDVKPDNVLIGTNGDAYVIDFGGGYHPMWVDKEFCDSRDGDLQGLDRLEAFLT